MISFVAAGFEDLARDLTDLEKKQLPYAMRRAIGDVVKAAAVDMKAAMRQDFDRPTPFTLNALYAKPPSGKSGTAAEGFVGIRDYATKGTPASKYLAPEIEGGGRNTKRFERRLAFAGVVPAGSELIPGRGAPIDQYGNVSAPFISMMLSQMRASSDPMQNMSQKTQARLAKRKLLVKTARGLSPFFEAPSKHSGAPLVIRRRVGKDKVEPVFFIAGSAPHYSARFDFHGIAQAAYGRLFQPAMAKWFEVAWATRRR